jgi:hypothetical protein
VPPGAFIAGVVKLAMMGAAERNGKLVADLAAKRLWLGEADVVRVGGEGATDKAWLRGDVAEMLFVPDAARFAEGQGALVDRQPQFGGLKCSRK